MFSGSVEVDALPSGEVGINISLLAHIAADSELQGRYGVQGQVFANTIGYFKQYLIRTHSGTESLRQLVASVSQLHTLAKEIHALTHQGANQARAVMDKFSSRVAGQIAELQPNQELMLPGGWQNTATPGHAMIYHFKREANGVIRFYIYNAGAGVEYHEKKSLPDNERYFSTKVYEFDRNVSREQLNHLIERLVLARVPHLRAHEWDEKKLYEQSIDEVIPHLVDLTETQPRLASELFDEVLTTTGQISGTCTQRSIHQMVKHHFGHDLGAYQRFILDFKISAIDDYLRTHTRHGQLHCHPHIQELINLAIVNTIKICDIPSLFVDNNEKRTKLNALYALQDSLSNAFALTVKPANRGVSSYTYCLPAQPCLSSASNEGDLHHLRNPVRPAVRISLDQSLVVQLEDILSQCQEGDSLWVMDQIEHVILTLPLPSDFKQQHQHPTYGAIVRNSEQFNRLQGILLQLQDVYNAKRHATVGNKQLASQTVVQMSFLALQDYFLRHHCAAESLPRFDAFFAQHSHHFFHGNRHSPYLASHHVATDHRFIELKKLYQNDSDNRTNQLMSPYRNRSDKISYINHYNALLRLHLALFQELGQRYIPPTDVKLKELLATNNAQELYFFLEQFDAYGAIKADSFLNEEQWNPLVETFRKQLVVERLVLNTVSPLYRFPFNLSVQPKLGKCPIDKSIVFNTPLSIASIDSTPLSMQLIDHQYALEVSAEKKAFVDDTLMHLGSFARMNKVSSNVIQLSSHDESTERVINKEDFFIRDLFHLRTSPTHQVNLTLDYFQSAHHHLVDENIQRYVEGNVFEPGLLMAVLHDDPTFLARFDRFIQTGIQAFVTVNNEMTQEALFLFV